MFDLIRLEWIKTFGKWRTYIGFLAIAVLIPLMFIGMKFDQGRFFTNSPAFKALQQNFFILGNIFNGYFVSQMVMYFLMVHIPFLIVLVAGDQVAGEATAGTLRMILIRPPSRLKIFTAKVTISILYTVLLVLFLGFLSLSLGVATFGVGDLLVLEKGLLIISQQQVLYRFLLAYILAVLAMCVIASLSLLLSVLVENAIGPIIGTMAIVVVSVIISETPIRLFEKIKPFLFTTYTVIWKKAFLNPLPWPEIMQAVLYLILFGLLFLAIAGFIFNKKDVLS
jgi:ABC-2 type transport system permease protein